MHMDLNDVRSLVTLLSLALFLSLMVWTFWPARRGAHEAAARLPFDGESQDADQGAAHGATSSARVGRSTSRWRPWWAWWRAWRC
jgi:cytochrome c oxidase cbb3-type subunit 4